MLFAVSGPVDIDPEVACAPDQAPLAVQLVAFVDDQVRVAASPALTAAGLTLMLTVGSGTGSPGFGLEPGPSQPAKAIAASRQAARSRPRARNLLINGFRAQETKGHSDLSTTRNETVCTARHPCRRALLRRFCLDFWRPPVAPRAALEVTSLSDYAGAHDISGLAPANGGPIPGPPVCAKCPWTTKTRTGSNEPQRV